MSSVDEAIFEALLAPVVADAHRLATGLLQDPGLAEDAVQEAAVKAWSSFGSFRPGAAFRPWFLAVVANQARDMRRARRRRPWFPMPDRLRDPQVLEDVLTERGRLRQALARLEHRDQLLVVLHYYLRLPWSEIAEITGVKETTARSRVHRARRRLRPQLNSQEVTA